MKNTNLVAEWKMTFGDKTGGRAVVTIQKVTGSEWNGIKEKKIRFERETLNHVADCGRKGKVWHGIWVVPVIFMTNRGSSFGWDKSEIFWRHLVEISNNWVIFRKVDLDLERGCTRSIGVPAVVMCDNRNGGSRRYCPDIWGVSSEPS